MLMPKRVKHRKQQRGSMKGRAYRGNKVTYGDFGIMAMEPTWITSNQIEAARVAMTRHIKRGGDVWIKIFPDKPVSAKPIGTRMGSGKGAPEYWVAVARVAMTRHIKRGGDVWIKIFPDKPVSAKPIGTRMGSGKGAPEYWVAVVKPGRVMFEIGGVAEETAREALRLAIHKLPIKCKIVSKAEAAEMAGDHQ